MEVVIKKKGAGAGISIPVRKQEKKRGGDCPSINTKKRGKGGEKGTGYIIEEQGRGGDKRKGFSITSKSYKKRGVPT